MSAIKLLPDVSVSVRIPPLCFFSPRDWEVFHSVLILPSAPLPPYLQSPQVLQEWYHFFLNLVLSLHFPLLVRQVPFSTFWGAAFPCHSNFLSLSGRRVQFQSYPMTCPSGGRIIQKTVPPFHKKKGKQMKALPESKGFWKRLPPSLARGSPAAIWAAFSLPDFSSRHIR